MCLCVRVCVCTKIRLTSTMPAMYLVSVKKPPLINGVKRLLGEPKNPRQVYERTATYCLSASASISVILISN